MIKNSFEQLLKELEAEKGKINVFDLDAGIRRNDLITLIEILESCYEFWKTKNKDVLKNDSEKFVR